MLSISAIPNAIKTGPKEGLAKNSSGLKGKKLKRKNKK